MSAKLNIVDKNLITKALKDMSGPERELTKLRLREVADAVAITSDFKRLLALQILEEDGTIPEGTVANAMKVDPKENNTSPSVSSASIGNSVFAQMRPGRSGQ